MSARENRSHPSPQRGNVAATRSIFGRLLAGPLAASLTFHAIVVVLLLTLHFGGVVTVTGPRPVRVSLAAPNLKEPEPIRPLPAPPPQELRRAPLPEPRRFELPVARPPAPARAPEAVLEAPVIAVAPQPSPAIEIRETERPRPVLPPPPPSVKTGVLSSARLSDTPKPPARTLERAGFGTTKAATAGPARASVSAGAFASATTAASNNAARTVAQPGSFGAAVSGTVPARGGLRPGAASGFGDSQVSATQPAPSSEVKENSFGGARVEQAVTPRVAAAPEAKTGLEVLSKPRPVYTEAARRQGIEGEVSLELNFRATGVVEIVRLVKGLGYGLDEAAIEAAKQIDFRPAQRDGKAVDSTAIVRIIFQLAY